jgi:hypothetical protein
LADDINGLTDPINDASGTGALNAMRRLMEADSGNRTARSYSMTQCAAAYNLTIMLVVCFFLIPSLIAWHRRVSTAALVFLVAAASGAIFWWGLNEPAIFGTQIMIGGFAGWMAAVIVAGVSKRPAPTSKAADPLAAMTRIGKEPEAYY